MEEEFERIYRDTAHELFWIGFALTKDQSTAENAVQDTFLYLWNHREKLLHSSFLYAYLVKSVKNYALNYCRKKHVHQKHTSQIIYSSLSISDIDEEQYAHQLKLAQELILELPERCREIFVKCVMEGMSYRECAEEMNVSVNTVKFQVKTAYDKLRKAAKDEQISLFLLLYSLI